jgi:hypothetical protein
MFNPTKIIVANESHCNNQLLAKLCACCVTKGAWRCRCIYGHLDYERHHTLALSRRVLGPKNPS